MIGRNAASCISRFEGYIDKSEFCSFQASANRLTRCGENELSLSNSTYSNLVIKRVHLLLVENCPFAQ